MTAEIPPRATERDAVAPLDRAEEALRRARQACIASECEWTDAADDHLQTVAAEIAVAREVRRDE